MKIEAGMTVYQAVTYVDGKYTVEDYPTDAEAVAVCEAIGEGTIVKFYAHRNMPSCLPEIVLKSCSLKVFEHGKWRDICIF